MNIYRKMWWPKTATLLNLNEKAVYITLVNKWKMNGRKPFTLYQTEIADNLGISKSSVKRVVRELLSHSVISVQKVSGVGHARNLYSLDTYLTGDSDDLPNYLEDGSMLLSKDDVDYLFSSEEKDEELERICL